MAYSSRDGQKTEGVLPRDVNTNNERSDDDEFHDVENLNDEPLTPRGCSLNTETPKPVKFSDRSRLSSGSSFAADDPVSKEKERVFRTELYFVT
jgi:hypothetical protein